VDRINSILMQLIACLQSHQCVHYLQSSVDLFKDINKRAMGITAKAAWSVVRAIAMDECCWEDFF